MSTTTNNKNNSSYLSISFFYFSSVIWSPYWAVGCRAQVKASRPSAGSSTVYRITYCRLNSDLCSGICHTHKNTIMVSFCSFSFKWIYNKTIFNSVLFLFFFPRWCFPAEWASCHRHVSVSGSRGAEQPQIAGPGGHCRGRSGDGRSHLNLCQKVLI